jgi:hypothetical protein
MCWAKFRKKNSRGLSTIEGMGMAPQEWAVSKESAIEIKLSSQPMESSYEVEKKGGNYVSTYVA